ncbi:Glutathione transferase [Ascochyta lentis]
MDSLITIEVPRAYGFVLLTATTTHLLSLWHSGRIPAFRQAAQIPHPCAFASAETIARAPTKAHRQALYLFNCAQRAHANFLENFTATLSALLLAGLKYPRLAALLGLLWCAGRVVYAMGYTSQSEENVEGSGRWAFGGYHVAAVCQVVLVGLVGWMGVGLLRV